MLDRGGDAATPERPYRRNRSYNLSQTSHFGASTNSVAPAEDAGRMSRQALESDDMSDVYAIIDRQVERGTPAGMQTARGAPHRLHAFHAQSGGGSALDTVATQRVSAAPGAPSHVEGLGAPVRVTEAEGGGRDILPDSATETFHGIVARADQAMRREAAMAASLAATGIDGDVDDMTRVGPDVAAAISAMGPRSGGKVNTTTASARVAAAASMQKTTKEIMEYYDEISKTPRPLSAQQAAHYEATLEDLRVKRAQENADDFFLGTAPKEKENKDYHNETKLVAALERHKISKNVVTDVHQRCLALYERHPTHHLWSEYGHLLLPPGTLTVSSLPIHAREAAQPATKELRTAKLLDSPTATALSSSSSLLSLNRRRRRRKQPPGAPASNEPIVSSNGRNGNAHARKRKRDDGARGDGLGSDADSGEETVEVRQHRAKRRQRTAKHKVRNGSVLHSTRVRAWTRAVSMYRTEGIYSKQTDIVASKSMSAVAGDTGVGGGNGDVALVSGDVVLEDIMATLDQFKHPKELGKDLVRQPHQKEFHEAMMIACLVAIYKSDFDRRQTEIMERYFSGKRLEQEVLVVTSRGVGKTWSVAMFICALLICVPAIDIAVFAQGQENSNAVITLVMQLLEAHPRGAGMILYPTSVKHVRLRGPYGAKDVRHVRSYPSTSKSARGVHCQVTIVDEMAYIPDDLFLETILPTLVKKNAALIGISTPRGEDDLYTYLCSLPDPQRDEHDPVTGKVIREGRMFKVMQVTNACDACIASGNELKCDHKAGAGTAWKSTDKQNRVRVIYRDHPELERQELLGLANTKSNNILNSDYLDELATTFRELQANPGCIYVAVDPANGGVSELAATAMVFVNDVALIVAMGSQRGLLTSVQEEAWLNAFFDIVRAHPYCQDAPIIFIPEANLQYQATHLTEYVNKRDTGIFTMREMKRNGQNYGYGVLKDQRNTFAYAKMMRLRLGVKGRGGIAFSSHLAVLPPTESELSPNTPKAREYMIKLFIQQAKRLRYDPIGKKGYEQIAGQVRHHIHAKKGIKGNDDVLIATIMILFWRNVFKEQRLKYEEIINCIEGYSMHY